MKNCEIIVNFSSEPNNLSNFINLDNVKIYTDDHDILKEFNQSGYEIYHINSHVGFHNKETNEINDICVEHLNILRNSINDEKLKKYHIVDNLKLYHLQRLIFLQRIKKILEISNNVIFIFKRLTFHYFAIYDIALSLEYKSKHGVIQISKDGILQLDFKNKKIDKFPELVKEIAIQESLQIEDSFETRLKEVGIDKKTEEFAFFLINNETDFYLKPVYPILQKFEEEKIKYVIFTFDDRTKHQLSKRGFKTYGLNELIDEISLSVLKIKTSEKTKRNISKNNNIKILNDINDENEIKSEEFGLNDRSEHKSTLDKFGRKTRYDRKLHWFKRRTRYDRKLHWFKRRTRYDRKLHWFKRRIILKIRRKLLNLYFNSLQYNKLVRSITSHPAIKPKLLQVSGLIENEFIIEIPLKEMKIVKNHLECFRKISTNDFVLKAYTKYVSDVSHVNQIARVIAIHTISEYIIKNHNFKSIFTAVDGSPANNVVCNIAKKFNIPTFSFPQIFVRINKIHSVLLSASQVLVSGIKIKDELVKLGMVESRIKITGNPRYDYFNSQNEMKLKTMLRNRLRDRMSNSLLKSDKLIIVAMSRWHEKDDTWMSELIKFCNLNDLDILIKIHPMYKSITNYEFSQEKIQRIKNKCEHDKYHLSYDVDLSKLWSKTKVLITDHSIVSVEAILSKIPIIFTKLHDDEKFEGDEYLNEGVGLFADTQERLQDNIIKILNDRNIQQKLREQITKFIQNYNYKDDGLAAQRIINLMNVINFEKNYHND